MPAFEFNHSPVEGVHLHLVVPYANVYPSDGSGAQHGLGDVEVGVKYRFVHESDEHPQVGIVPMVELDTGDADKGLGNGKTWFTLPVWIQKSFSDWTTYGGGGRAFNSASGMRNYNFGGRLLQRKISDELILGGELFSQGATSVDGKSTTFLNFGGFYNASRSAPIAASSSASATASPARHTPRPISASTGNGAARRKSDRH